MRAGLKLLGLLSALLAGSSTLLAVPVFSVANGGIVIGAQNVATAGNTSGTAWTVTETMTAAGTLSLTDTDGNPLSGALGGFAAGSWITKTVTNNSGVVWTSFEMELQQVIGTPSGEGDGLSFAQGAGLVFTSSIFSTVTRIDSTRDYLNFSGGSVPVGGSVSFTFVITDNSPQSPIFLLQTPNRVDLPATPDAGSTILLLGMGLAGLAALRRKLA